MLVEDNNAIEYLCIRRGSRDDVDRSERERKRERERERERKIP